LEHYLAITESDFGLGDDSARQKSNHRPLNTVVLPALRRGLQSRAPNAYGHSANDQVVHEGLDAGSHLLPSEGVNQ